jgi:hypothetical protein
MVIFPIVFAIGGILGLEKRASPWLKLNQPPA